MTSRLPWRAISQISQCIRQISHNAPFITEMCTHVHISVTNWCVVRYLSNALRGYMRLTQYGIWEMGLSAFCSSGTSLVISDVTHRSSTNFIYFKCDVADDTASTCWTNHPIGRSNDHVHVFFGFCMKDITLYLWVDELKNLHSSHTPTSSLSNQIIWMSPSDVFTLKTHRGRWEFVDELMEDNAEMMSHALPDDGQTSHLANPILPYDEDFSWILFLSLCVCSVCHEDALAYGLKRFPYYWAFCEENPPVTGGVSSQMSSNI